MAALEAAEAASDAAGERRLRRERLDVGAEFVAPSGELQTWLAGVWSELLNVDRVGALDDFFELGGDSLLAVHLNATLREAFQVDVPMVRVFESPTVSGLAQTIAALCAENTDLEKLEETLRQVQGLSDDEVARLLEEPGLGVDG
jgi:acyl carrier protein